MRLSRHIQVYAPTSIETKTVPLRNLDRTETEVLHTLSNFVLSASSTPLHLKTLPAPFHASVKHVLNSRGYPSITEPVDKTHKSVLICLDGPPLSTHQLKQAIDDDGRHRGLNWTLLAGEGAIRKLDMSGRGECRPQSSQSESKKGHHGWRSAQRWMLSFQDENEARRFVRSWHRRAIGLNSGNIEDEHLAHCRLLW